MECDVHGELTICQAHVLEGFTYFGSRRAKGNEFGKVVWTVITENLAKQNAGTEKQSRIFFTKGSCSAHSFTSS